MNSFDNVNTKFVCQYCHSNIKGKEEMLSCPECHSAYHIDCWYENEGCGVYGCTYKISNPKVIRNETSVTDILINAEYLINVRHFVEALNECRRILVIDKNNIDAKKTYNKIVTLVNTKTKLIESGDLAFQANDLKSAEIYFKEALKYSDESEMDLINAKLQIISEKAPRILKKKRLNNFITAVISIVIIAAAIFLIYYFVYQREYREFSSIEKNDNTVQISELELQIAKYEKFLQQFKNGDLMPVVKEKINILVIRLIGLIYKDDWRTSYRFLQKIDTTLNLKTYRDYRQKIFITAKEEYTLLIKEAKTLDKEKQYIEAKSILEKAIAIIEVFFDTDLKKEKTNISSAIALMNKKQAAVLKLTEIEKEISEKEKRYDELKKYSNVKSSELTLVIKDVKSPSLVIARISGSSRLIAIRTGNEQYYTGETISVECVRDGSITYENSGEELTLPLYIPVFSGSYSDNIYSKFEFESVVQRLRYLREQKEKFQEILLKVF